MTRKKEPPVQALTVFLLKEGFTRYEDALEDSKDLQRYKLIPDLRFEGALFVAPQQTRPPKWRSFVQEGIIDDVDNLYNASTKAVLFVHARGRTLAYVFGYGRSLLSSRAIERSFGLRVVVNTVDEKGLRSIDSKTIQELTLHTRRQVSRSSSLAEFSIDREEEILGAVTGIPRDETFARLVTGFDALQFRARIRFQDLGDRSLQILEAYASEDYKERGFGFIDYVQRVTDPALIELLDEKMLADLKCYRLGHIHMAPPEIIDWEVINEFSFTKKGNPERDMSVESFLGEIRSADDLTVEGLKRRYVFVHPDEATEPKRSWPVYRVLVTEVEHGDGRYVLSGGVWYEIEKDFADGIRKKAEGIKLANLGLPPAHPGEPEPAYNERVAKASGAALIDRKCARLDGDPIEPCDLLTVNRQFVHVKWWSASSTLSHLFAQGKVAAEAFLWDKGFREELKRVLKGQSASSLADDIPADRPDPAQYQVVFGIIKGGREGWERPLPFFSQLHMVRTAEALRKLGFEARLERISVEDDCTD